MAEKTSGKIIGGKYRVLSELGRGAMGVVYKAEQLDVEGRALREVGLKMVRPELSLDPQLASEFSRRFLREVRIAARLSNPHIVMVHDFGQAEEGQLYFTMEFIRGQTLKDILQRQGALPIDRVVTIVAQVCDALSEAHSQLEPIVHRDLKPGNIFITEHQGQDWVKVGDFGIAKILGQQGDGLTRVGGSVGPGTPRYMAPEQWLAQELDSRADLYALGIMMYEMLAGRPPFSASEIAVLMHQHLHEVPPQLPASIPAGIRTLVGQLLAKKPYERPADAEKVRRALEAAIAWDAEQTTIILQPEGNPALSQVEEEKQQTEDARHRGGISSEDEKDEKKGASRWVYRMATVGGLMVLVLLVAKLWSRFPQQTVLIDSLRKEVPGHQQEALHREEGLQKQQQEQQRQEAAGRAREEEARRNTEEQAQLEAEAKKADEEKKRQEKEASKKAGEQERPETETGKVEKQAQRPQENKARFLQNMALVPAGAFWMGCDEKADRECEEQEKPGHTVYVDAFSIDKYEVTVAEYQQCVEAGGCTTDNLTLYSSCNWGKEGRANHPMNCVDWEQARTFCKWAGKRLPTEAEWEKAARGTDRRKYPWGDQWDARKAHTNENLGKTVPVGSYASGVNPYGVHNLIGNVSEWVQDWYGDRAYAQYASVQNPHGPDEGYNKVLRGGGWKFSLRPRASSRSSALPSYLNSHVGMRCAR
jgi:formylglycine-generating enzyme required for sulfatase activity/serine/threonine protein kinase